MNPPAGLADERPVLGPLGLAVDGVGKALGQDCWAMAEPTLGQAFTLVDELQRDLDRLAAALVAEVDARGAADVSSDGGRGDGGHGVRGGSGGRGGGGRGGGGRGGSRVSRRSRLTDWARAYAPAMPERQRHQLVRVGAAVADDRAHPGVHGSPDRPTVQAFSTGLVRLPRADLMLSTMAAVRPFLLKASSNDLRTSTGTDAGVGGPDGPDGLDGLDGLGEVDEDAEYQGILLPLAATGTDRDFATAAAHLAGLLRPETDADEADRACRSARSLTERPGPAGMTEFRLRADPLDAGTVRAAVAALSAPVPDADGPDPRTAAQRRADALLMVLRRGMAATSSCTGHHRFNDPNTTSPATTSPDDTDAASRHDDGAGSGPDTNGGGSGPDANGGGSGTGGGCPGVSPITLVVTMTLDQLTGAHAGVGTTETGHPIPAALARRMACDAAVIPAVLGAGSQVLDLGRANRLATPAQRHALTIRENGRCNYPGCSIPASWCDVHHLIWWSRGGRTDLDQLTLLCKRHHTTVHDRHLSGTIDQDGHTTWDIHRWDITRQ